MGHPTLALSPSPALRLLGRSAMIAAMLAGGLLCAGISQAHAQDAELIAPPTPAQMAAERARELVAAVGGPASAEHLVAFAPKTSDVEVRDDDVEDAAPDPSAALNAAQLNAAQLNGSDLNGIVATPAPTADMPLPPPQAAAER